MVLDRPYRKGMDHAAVLEYLRNERKRAFDPEIVDLFVLEMRKKKRGKGIVARPGLRASKAIVRKLAAGDL
jgi:HD-GYP domain-containing protein (c-di-GMP phosphodiesterase class II)